MLALFQFWAAQSVPGEVRMMLSDVSAARKGRWGHGTLN